MDRQLCNLQRVKVCDKVMAYITFFPERGYYPHFVDINRISWISTLRENYPHFVDIIRLLWKSWIYPHFVDIICIGHITSFLTFNVHPIFHIYPYNVSD